MNLCLGRTVLQIGGWWPKELADRPRQIGRTSGLKTRHRHPTRSTRSRFYLCSVAVVDYTLLSLASTSYHCHIHREIFAFSHEPSRASNRARSLCGIYVHSLRNCGQSSPGQICPLPDQVHSYCIKNRISVILVESICLGKHIKKMYCTSRKSL